MGSTVVSGAAARTPGLALEFESEQGERDVQDRIVSKVMLLGALGVLACGGSTSPLPQNDPSSAGNGSGTGNAGEPGGGDGGAPTGQSGSGGRPTGGRAGSGTGTGGSAGGVVGTGGASAGAGVAGATGGVGAAGGTAAGSNGPVPSPCALPFDSGPCEAAIPVFAFSAAQGRCVEEIYGGCQGNANRFDTLEQCEAACLDPNTLACESDDECGYGEIGSEILAPSDCMCLFGCAFIPLNLETIERRRDAHEALCDPTRDGQGNPCPIDDCAQPAPAMCVDRRCTGDPFGG